LAALAIAAVPSRHSLADGISDAKSERTADQKSNHDIRHRFATSREETTPSTPKADSL
jgi:hypothetical protein